MWGELFAMPANPLTGLGYQSFWLGNRLLAIWTNLDTTFLNEAHNGYLEMYLNLGLIGLALLCVFMVSGYRTVCKQLTIWPHFASLSLALWSVAIVYNITESAFGAWLLLVHIAPSRYRRSPVRR